MMTSRRVLGWTLPLVTAMALAIRLALPPTSGEPVAAPNVRAVEAREFWAIYQAAGARRMADDCVGAVEGYRAALAVRPGHEDSLYYLGNCLFEQARYADALETYRQLVALNPDGSARGYIQLALVHASLMPGASFDLDESERAFQRAADLEPDSGGQLGLAEIAVLRGDDARARRLLTHITAESPMHVPAPYLLGYLAYRAGAAEDAWRYFTLAMERMTRGMPPSQWSEEGDVKSAPALRWRALARQSVFGRYWLALRADALAGSNEGAATPTPADMRRAYGALDAAIVAARTRQRGRVAPS